ncbi:hypothetical protein EL17_08530 [Anditalea andensis]|uniref:Uncharacterized protein n=2 Tax=Anditalea andensis TaxID=1048983 RepID=A0A074KZ42_9BACT|nr:hypothetical protein EL17_08530 [Anditalea andensis]
MINGNEELFIKIIFPVLLFLAGSVIFKYVKQVTIPLLLIATFTCFFLIGQGNYVMVYLVPLYLLMYIGGYHSAGWYAKNILTKS